MSERIIDQESGIVIELYPAKNPSPNRGWGDAFIGIPENHPWYNTPFDEIPLPSDCLEITTGGHSSKDFDPNKNYNLLGFDTWHLHNKAAIHDKQYVIAEAQRIADYLKKVASCIDFSI